MTTDKLTDLAVTSNKLAESSVSAGKIAPKAVQSTHLSECGDFRSNSEQGRYFGKNRSASCRGRTSGTGIHPGQTYRAGSHSWLSLEEKSIMLSHLADESRSAEALFADGSIPGVKIGSQSITEAHLSPSSVSGAALQANAVSGDKIKPLSISAVHLQEASVQSDHLGVDIVRSQHMDEGSVTGRHLASGSVNARHIQAESIESAHITNDAVLPEHIAGESIQSGHLAEGAVSSSILNYSRFKAITWRRTRSTLRILEISLSVMSTCSRTALASINCSRGRKIEAAGGGCRSSPSPANFQHRFAAYRSRRNHNGTCAGRWNYRQQDC